MWIFTYLILLLLGFIATLLLTRLASVLAPRYGLIDYPQQRKFHKKATPLLGGAAMFIGFWGVIFGALLILRFLPTVVPEAVVQYISGVWKRLPWLFVVFVGGLAISVVGLLDDKYDVKVTPKLILQFLVAIFTVCMGIRIKLFLPFPFDYLISVIWIVAIINSFNLLDNMDGVSAGVACVASFILLLVAFILKNYFIGAVLAVFIGSLLGFLKYNFPPASIFMGDCGSMFIGYVISVITILGTYFGPSTKTIFPVVIPILVLAVPLFDTISVVVIRKIRGKPIFEPDKSHFPHRLVDMGMSVRTTLIFSYLTTLCIGLPSILLPLLPLSGVLIVFFQALIIISLIVILEYYSKSNRKM